MSQQRWSEDVKAKHELLSDLYAKFNAREIDEVLAMLDPAVDWLQGMAAECLAATGCVSTDSGSGR
jgi:hypothetical protein